MNIGELRDHLTNLLELELQFNNHKEEYYNLPTRSKASKDELKRIDAWGCKYNDLETQILTIKSLEIT